VGALGTVGHSPAELKSPVRSLTVVMVDILIQYSLEVTPATFDQPVQAFASSTSRQALGMGVGFRSLSTCKDHHHTLTRKDTLDGDGNFLSLSQIRLSGSGNASRCSGRSGSQRSCFAADEGRGEVDWSGVGPWGMDVAAEPPVEVDQIASSQSSMHSQRASPELSGAI